LKAPTSPQNEQAVKIPKIFYSKSIPPQPIVPEEQKQSDYLKFDSEFECGNLESAMVDQLSLNNYVLLTQADYNSNGHY
jgi:hypothetical protein